MAKRERKRLAFEPQWDGPIAGWAHKYAARHFWKVAHLMDYEDLIQDAYIKFLICCRKYPHVVEPQHFMSLFQRAFSNHIITLAKKQTGLGYRVDSINTDEEDDDIDVVDTLVGELRHGGEMQVALSQMPEEGRELLIAMLSDSDGTFRQERYVTDNTRGLKARETTNEYWCRIMGFDPEEVDLPGMVRAFLADA